MSRIVTDPDLLSWEVYATTGPFGLPDRPKIIFNCLTDPTRRPRFAVGEGDAADAQRMVDELSDGQLGEMLVGSSELR